MINYTEILDQRREEASIFSNIVRHCQFLLFNCKEAKNAKEYILGRMSSKMIKKFGIGYFPPTKHLHYLLSMMDSEKLVKIGLAYKHEIFNGSNVENNYISYFEHHDILFPIWDERNSIVAVSARTMKSNIEQKELKIQKYKNSQYDKSLYCYGLNFARESILKNDRVIIVEGQVDCCSLHNCGVVNSIALTGGVLARYQFNLLFRLTKNITLLLDNDDAGNKASEKIIKQYGNICSIVRKKIPDPYKDIDSYLKDHTFSELDDINYGL